MYEKSIDDFYSIADVANMVGISIPTGRTTATINCPFCGETKKKMNINLQKNMFRCFKCDVKGNQVSLYAFAKNISTKEAYKELMATTNNNNSTVTTPIHKKVAVPEVVEQPLLEEVERDKTLKAFLKGCSLAPDHEISLQDKRGMDINFIQSRGYKTAPKMNLELHAQKLLEEGYYINGVPGFYRNDNGDWTFVTLKRGILIPYHSFDNKILGFQLRVDDKLINKERGDSKCIWISSVGRKSGTRAKTFINYSCEYITINGKTVPKVNECIALTEGGMKGDIFYHLTGQPCIAIPGTTAHTLLKEELLKLKKIGVKKVLDCLDMDYLTNEHVMKDMLKIKEIIAECGMEYQRVTWNPEYKGIDDYYLFKLKGIK